MHNKQAIKSKQIISYTSKQTKKIIKSHDKQTHQENTNWCTNKQTNKHTELHKTSKHNWRTNKQTNKHTPSYTKQANTTDAQTNTQQERPTVEVKENFAVVKQLKQLQI